MRACQLGRPPADRLFIVAAPRPFHLVHVLFDPDPEPADRLAQGHAQRREPILDSRRDRCVHTPCHEPVTFELPQRPGQHFLAYPADALLQARESHLLLAFQRVDDQQRPFVGDALQHFAHKRLLFGQEVR